MNEAGTIDVYILPALKSAARSSLKLPIEDTLDTLPDAYDRPLYAQKCTAVFEHVYESYPERNAGIYAEMA